jgi:rhamnosyl/mannosyltransferase
VLYHSDIVRQRRLLAAYGPFLERFLDRVDLIVTSSPDMIEHSPFLAPRAGKCRVVPFGLPQEKLTAAPGVRERAAELRAAHAGRPLVLFVGRLVYYKGVDVLVRAMAGVDADLVLIGRGPLEADLRALTSSLGMGARTTFLPAQDDAELAAWYHAADVLCLPSVARSEAFGLVQIEAHAAGTPVVSTALTTGVPFANRDGVTGLVVPPGDPAALAGALRRLLEDDALRALLGGQAQRRARREFTVPRMVAGTVEVYREAGALHGAGARRRCGVRHRASEAPCGGRS